MNPLADGPGNVTIRTAAETDFPTILALNTEWVHFTSHLDDDSLSKLHHQSPYHRVAEADGRVIAFLLALREGCDYDSPNYRWFANRGGAFLYIDRVVVDAAGHGKGIARLLYDDLVTYARESGVRCITCELDVEPPNDASRGFHDRYGFREVGTQWVANGTKRVSLREIIVPEPDSLSTGCAVEVTQTCEREAETGARRPPGSPT